MSAFILSDKHFQVITEYIFGQHDVINKSEFANKLKKINIQSVNYRYNENTRFSRVKFENVNVREYSLFDIIRLIQCWDYQSCENSSNIDYLTMSAFLLSHFENNDIDESRVKSNLWSI